MSRIFTFNNILCDEEAFAEAFYNLTNGFSCFDEKEDYIFITGNFLSNSEKNVNEIIDFFRILELNNFNIKVILGNSELKFLKENLDLLEKDNFEWLKLLNKNEKVEIKNKRILITSDILEINPINLTLYDFVFTNNEKYFETGLKKVDSNIIDCASLSQSRFKKEKDEKQKHQYTVFDLDEPNHIIIKDSKDFT